MEQNIKNWIKRTSLLLYKANIANSTEIGLYFKRKIKKILVKNSYVKEFVSHYNMDCNAFYTKNNFFSSGINSKQEAQLEATLILCHCLKISKIKLYCTDEFIMTKKEEEFLSKTLKRRLKGEPLAYIFGEKQFYGLDFSVNKHTLIPRPETELLLDEAFKYQTEHSHGLLLDLGCGTGCIGLTFLKHRKNFKIMLVDNSEKALEVAYENAKKHDLLEHCFFYLADFTSPDFIKNILDYVKNNLEITKEMTTGLFDIIISNPPYIPDFEYKKLHHTVRSFEPKTALVSEAIEPCDGALHLSKVVNIAEKTLVTNGLFLLEHGYNQGNQVKNLCQHLLWKELETKKDYAGHDRYLRGVFA